MKTKNPPITNGEIIDVLQETFVTLTESEKVGGIIASPSVVRELQVINSAIERIKQTPDWQPISQGLPDSDSTVLIAIENADEPIWIGFHDGEQWRYLDATAVLPLRVTHWANFPEGPK
jgi:hypothetical protein